MESFFSRYRNSLFLAVVLLAQVLGLAVQVRRSMRPNEGESRKVILWRYWAISAVSPFERAFLFVGHGIRNGWSGYVDLRHVRQQNQDLQAEVTRLRLEQAGLAEDARQGERLQALLAFKSHYVYQTVAAQVIGTGGSDHSQVFYLDKGTNDGVKTDMAVITADGIVGKVRDAFPDTSLVLGIADSTSGAGAMLEATRIRGVLRGSASMAPIINVLPDERIKPGELVLTSGGDQIYPRGLVIGRVAQVRPDPEHDPYVAVVVKPAADLARLEEVLVITDVRSTMMPGAQQDTQTSEGMASESQKAADVIAERLPGLKDAASQTAAKDGQSLKDKSGAAAKDGAPAPPRIAPALHPDRYSPGAMQPAAQMIPGAANGSSASRAQVGSPAEVPEGPLPAAKAEGNTGTKGATNAGTKGGASSKRLSRAATNQKRGAAAGQNAAQAKRPGETPQQ